MNFETLIENWSVPDRSAEKVAVQLRLPYDLYASLHALKEIYPKQSVNEIVRDLLTVSIAELVERLPVYKIGYDEAQYLSEQACRPIDDFIDADTGPKINFKQAYRRIMEERKQDESTTELRAVS